MAASRFQRATALVPLALLSTAATAALAGVGPTSAVADQQPVSTLPDGSTVPTEAIEAPASLSRPGVVAPGVEGGYDGAVASTSGIPDAALTAYQRAETVINAADRSCDISWQLIAAIGRVESDHGRVNGSALDDEGLATPGIVGIPLDGDNNTAVIRDTDAGQYDSDTRYDRAVGPMQFLPSTWSVVGVDGDNDGKRNPQDIDDAALASAVYLCSGDDDLATDAGRRAAVFRYNHSQDYVDLVLSFMGAYLDGDYTSVPNGTSTSGVLLPSPEPVRPDSRRRASSPVRSTPTTGNSGTRGDGGSRGDARGDDGTPSSTTPTGGGDGGDDDGGDDGGDAELSQRLDPPPAEPRKTVDDGLSKAQATATCGTEGVVDDPTTASDELATCIADLMNP